MIELNPKQREAFDTVINGKNKVTVLVGEAGTGKSVTTAEIINHFPGTISITATTNKAKENIARMAEKEANTVQSEMGFVIVQKNFKQQLSKVRDAYCSNLLIVDEVSMLPIAVYEDILEYLKEGHIDKVLFLGDPIQLRSVGEGVDINKIEGVTIELTEQMRQVNPDSPVSKYLAEMRGAIKTIVEDERAIEVALPERCDEFHLTSDHKEFCQMYNETKGNKKILAYRNAVVNKYNEHIHGGENLFNEGDEVIINKPLGKARNGDTVQVLNVKKNSKYDKLDLKIITSFGEIFTISYWLSTAAYNERIDELRVAKEHDKYWAVVNFSIDLKHLYACTVHKSQGSSYTTVFIDASDIWAAHSAAKTSWNNPINYEDFLRLMYVSVSRMRLKAVVYIGSSRLYQYLGK